MAGRATPIPVGLSRAPVRTCVGCRARAPKPELLRVVASGTVLVPDERARMPGRGAYLHRDPQCLDLAERRRALGRALRVQGPLDARALREMIEIAVPASVQAGRHPPLRSTPGARTSTVSSPSEGRSRSDERSMSIER